MSTGGNGLAFGRYLLGERLGRGGMGEVYLGVQTGIGRFEKPLALKMLLPHLASNPRTVEMFLDEARVAATMNHPNVTQIFDVGLVDGRYFIAMELVLGVTLAQLIVALSARRQLPSEQTVLWVARSLFDGLHHAHSQRGARGEPLRLVHRDVTPHNVLVSREGAVKLADFGIARAQDSADEQSRLLGKRAYLPPEQLRGEGVDQRADLYSAALSLFHFASLTQPFARSSRSETLTEILEGPAPDLSKLRPDLPPVFTEVLSRALAKNPQHRPSSASEIRDAIPLPTPAALSELGELVQGSCAAEIEELEGKTHHTLARAKSTRVTAQLSSRGSQRRKVLFALAASAVAVAGALSLRTSSPAAEPPKPARGVGYLTVDADPWATVTVAGRLLGETPLSSFPVQSGRVQVELKNPETGRAVTRVVEIPEGERVFVKESLR